MILPGWQDPSGFATSARQYVAFVQLCCREIPRLHISFVASARISATLVQPSAKNTSIAKQCGSPPRRVVAVRRPVGKLRNLVPFEKLRRRWQVVEWFSEADCRTQPKKMVWTPPAPNTTGLLLCVYTSVVQACPSLTATFHCYELQQRRRRPTKALKCRQHRRTLGLAEGSCKRKHNLHSPFWEPGNTNA